jgi:predicted dehydrogenase
VKVTDFPQWDHPLGVANQEGGDGKKLANYRAAGLADMALAIIEGRPHRCSLEMSLHAIDVMASILKSGETGRFVDLTTTCERPAALDVEAARGLIEEKVPA